MDPAVVGVFIPVIAIVMGIGIAMLNLLLDYRKKVAIFELHHKERMAAIEKGLEVPPLPADLLRSNRTASGPGDYLRRGLILLFVGAGVTGAMMIEGHAGAYYGMIPAAIGVAYLLYYFLHARTVGVDA